MRIKIKDIADVFDGPHATPKKTKNGPYYLGINAISDNGKIDLGNSAHLSDEDYVKWTKRVEPRENDIVFSYEATLGRYAILPKNFHGSLGRRLALIRVKSPEVNVKWLYYYFYSPTWKKYIANRIVYGSTVNRISVDDFPNYEIDLPERQLQDRMVNVLSDIDEKYDLNNHMLDLLQDGISEIFDHWFLQYDFPDENNKAYKNNGGQLKYEPKLQCKIPVNWHAEKIENVIKQNSKSKISVKTVNNQGNIPFFTSGENILYTSKPLVNGMNMFLNTGGDADVKSYYGSASYSTDTWSITAKNGLEYYLPFLFDKFKPSMDQVFFQGTGLRHLQKDLFLNHWICIPDNDTVNSFAIIADNYVKKRTLILQENNKLMQIRNYLIPLLLTGQCKII